VEVIFMSRESSAARGAPVQAWRSRIVGEAEMPPGELLTNPRNWRRHPEAQRRALRGILGEVGWVQRLIVNQRTGRILDGHARLEEALARDEPFVPVLYVELSPDEEALVLATLDPIGAMAATDSAALVELLAQISTADEDLQALLAELAATNGSGPVFGADPDAIPALPEPAEVYVRQGELWALGDQRLLCGDALDAADVARLLAGAQPMLLATDPPYGVGLDTAWRDQIRPPDGRPSRSAARTEGHRNTDMPGDDRVDWSAAYALVPSLAVGYVWHAGLHAQEVAAGLEQIGFKVVSQVIWDKGRFAFGPSWYHWRHEACHVVRRPGTAVAFLGERDQSTIWESASPKIGGADGSEPKADHPAQKPVLLFERPIRNHLHPGQAVYDPFVGSGTTLIAAEAAGRRSFAMEINPRFAQLAIERWTMFTGRQAMRLDGER
jgi:ParB-like chromosome segregation protein Spo0J